MEKKLAELKERLEQIKSEVSQDRNNALKIKARIDNLNKVLSELKKECVELEQLKISKKKPFKLLKPFIIMSLKKSLGYLIGLVVTLLIALFISGNLGFVPIIISFFAVLSFWIVDFMYISKEIRHKIKGINLSEIENELEHNKKEQEKITEKVNNLKSEESQIWRKVSNSGNIIMSLNSEIRYMEEDINRESKLTSKPKELVKRKNTNKR